MQTHTVLSCFSSSESWSILSDIERSIKAKIEAVGTPLKDWGIQINYGIKTGFNDAFIIDSVRRNEILNACQSYSWSGLWLINTHNGTKEGLERIHIEDYPSIKEHLDNYRLRLETRADKGDTPYNLRNCAYLDLLSQPKIIWGEISDKTKFCLDREGKYVPEATTFMLSGDNLIVLLAFLNCSVSEYMFSTIGTTTGVGTVRWKKFKIEQLYVPRDIDENIAQAIMDQCERIINITAQKGSAMEEERILNSLIYRFYGLSDSEIQYIERQVR